MAFRISDHKTPIFLCGNEELSFVEIINCRLGKRGFVLRGNDESSCVGTRNCRVWERKLFSFGNDKSLCLATKEKACRVWEQRLFCVGTRICIARRNRIVLIDLEE